MNKNNNPRILIVDDDDNIQQTLSFILEERGYTITTAQDSSQAIKKFENSSFDAILIDYQLPGSTGVNLANSIKKISTDICIILITGHASLDSAIEAIKEGIYAYLIKPIDPSKLLDTLKKGLENQALTIENKQLLHELKEKNSELAILSITDELTGLYNKRHFYIKLTEEMTRAHRQNHPLSLFIFDIDNFKLYNDTNGHLAGDKVLQTIGALTIKNTRKHVDFAFRYGGDEFTVILTESDEKIALTVAERLRIAFQKLNLDKVKLSIGITIFVKLDTAETIVARADKALYNAKASGGNKSIYLPLP